MRREVFMKSFVVAIAGVLAVTGRGVAPAAIAAAVRSTPANKVCVIIELRDRHCIGPAASETMRVTTGHPWRGVPI